MENPPLGLSLSEALKSGKIDQFIREQESAGVGPISQADFDTAAIKVIKSGQSEDQTSRSASRDGSTGKRTR